MIRLLTRLLGPCFWTHGEWHKARNRDGVLVKRCLRCQQDIGPILGGEMITTPLKCDVPGAPTGAVRTAAKSSSKVIGWRR